MTTFHCPKCRKAFTAAAATAAALAVTTFAMAPNAVALAAATPCNRTSPASGVCAVAPLSIRRMTTGSSPRITTAASVAAHLGVASKGPGRSFL